MSKVFGWIYRTWEKIKPAVKSGLSQFYLPRGWARGPAAAVGVLLLVTTGYYGYDTQSGFGWAVDVFLPVALVALGYLLVLFIIGGIFRLLLKLPAALWLIIGAGVVGGYQVWGERTWLHIGFNVGLVLAAVLAGTGAYFIFVGWGERLVWQRVLSFMVLAVGVGGLVVVGWLVFFSPGEPAAPLAVSTERGAPQIDAPDPSQPGSYPVSYLTYGSGDDLRRPEFGADAGLITDPVDASRYVSFDGWKARLREFFFGFDENDYPLNGRVWYPQGEGPFPLVLIVHGNHNMVDFSDPGYDYLGELLASRGFIFVSVDQNFLNGGTYGRASSENDARAWLLLEHLAQWEEWHNDPASPFYQKVDLNNVGLIGHSRGGEAAALAVTFNRLDIYPFSARVRWNYDFGIKAVVAIAPVDQQWLPADHPNPMENVPYLVLQGSHDADLYYFDGIGQYQRAEYTRPEGEAFKSAFYIYRANHGQFNTGWGMLDYGGVRGAFINQEALLPAEEQRQIARLLISAFLEVHLHGEQAYRPIFEDPRTAGTWLPETGYITQYQDYGTALLADFEEDIDPTTATAPGTQINASGLQRWRELSPRFRNGDRTDNHAVQIGWSGGNSSYGVTLPPNPDWTLTSNTLLVFQAADDREPEEVFEGLDFSVALVDRFGRRVSIPLSEVLPLHTQFPAEIYRLPLWNEEYLEDASEPVFQGYRIPLAVFLARDPDFELSNLREIRFLFDRTESGQVLLDEIGFDLVP